MKISEKEKSLEGLRGLGQVLIVCPSVVVVKITPLTTYKAFSGLKAIRIYMYVFIYMYVDIYGYESEYE
jgi:hypothetical protein